MQQNHHNIVGYLQKKNFFNKSPSPIKVSPNSRFTNYTSCKTPEKQEKKGATPIRSLNSQIDLRATTHHRRQRQTEHQIVRQPKTHFKEQTAFNKKPLAHKRAFDSSRVEIKMCLEDLTRKVSSQLRLLESTVSDLTTHIQNLFQKRLETLRQKFIESAESIFNQTKSNLQQQLKKSEYFQFHKAQQTQKCLKEADARLKKLKGEMDNNWKKVAGQILMEELDDKLQVVLNQSLAIRKDLSQKVVKGQKKEDDEGWLLMKKGIDMLIKAKFMANL